MQCLFPRAFDRRVAMRVMAAVAMAACAVLAGDEAGAVPRALDAPCGVNACRALVDTFHVDPGLRADVRAMCERSPTFRRQVGRIVASDTAITMGFCVPRCSGLARARTLMTGDNGVLRRAQVEVRPDQAHSLIENIAHEFEHVLEQLDRVDLARLARIRGSGVRATRYSKSAFETERASRIGRAAAEEYRLAQPGAAACSGARP